MQAQPYNQQFLDNQAVLPKFFSVVLFGQRVRGEERAPVEIDNDATFNSAMDKARHFPLMPHERLVVYRGSFGKDCGAHTVHEVYSRTGRKSF